MDGYNAVLKSSTDLHDGMARLWEDGFQREEWYDGFLLHYMGFYMVGALSLSGGDFEWMSDAFN